jgi:SAM-dependent methyltransferase
VNKEEEKVREFYDSYGWVSKAAASGEDTLFRDFSPAYYPYHDQVNARTIECFAELSGRLLIAGGGDLPETHVTIANKFSEITCLDISQVAIDVARGKLGNRGEFVVGSILGIPRPEDYFDAAYCAHVIYHIDKDHQARAIRELIRVTKPGGAIVTIYSNPDSLPDRIARFKGRLPLLWKLKRKKPHSRPDAKNLPPLYFFAHPLSWWAQFTDQCDIEIRPWDVMGNVQEEAILINDAVASFGYRIVAWFEDKYPEKAARWWSYPLVILRKRPRGQRRPQSG